MKKILLFAILLCSLESLFAVTYIAVNSGDWNAETTWAVQRTGTISTTNGSTTLGGAGTLFTTELNVGDLIYTTSGVLLGTVAGPPPIGSNTTATLIAGATTTYSGNYCTFTPLLNAGTISTTSGSPTVSGIGTSFATDVNVGDIIYTSNGTVIGTVNGVGANLTLAANASTTYTNIAFFTSKSVRIPGTISTSTFNPNVTGAGTTFTASLSYGSRLYTTAIALIGTIASETADNTATFTGNANIGGGGIICRVGTVPLSSDIIIIPSGITVTSSTAISTSNSITVSGTLSITGNLGVTGNGAVTINNGGTITTSGNLAFSGNSPTPSFTVNTGGTLNITGNITGDNTQPITFSNSGDVELTGSLTADQMNFTNNLSGVLVIHGNVAASGSNMKIYNYGIITIDKTTDLIKTNFYNYATGKFFVFGLLTIDDSSSFFNIGLIDARDFTFGNISFTNLTCSSALTGTVATNSTSKNVSGTGTSFTTDLNIGSVLSRQSDCAVLGTVATIRNDTGLALVANATITFSGNYSIAQYGTLIVLDTLKESGASCPGCNLYSPGSVYYGYLDATLCCAAIWCNGMHCDTWIAGLSQLITPGRRIWLAADYIGYGQGLDGQAIKKWYDLSNTFGFSMSQNTGASQPILRNNSTDNINFNPVVNFNGSQNVNLNSYYLWSTVANGGLAMFAVALPASGSTGTPAIIDFGNQTTDGYGLGGSSANIMAYTPTGHGGVQSSAAGNGNAPALISSTTVWSGNQSLYLNGTSVSGPTVETLSEITATEVNANPTPTATSGPFTVGQASNTSSQNYSGNVGEVIVYASNVSTTTQQSVESFLALKYGITIPHSYLNYNGTVVRTYDAGYNTDVAGLAREDLNVLNQRKSKSCNAGAELTMSIAPIDNTQFNQHSIGSNLNNNSSYLIWGHNGGTVGTSGRIYKVTGSNFYQQVYMQFAISGLSPTPSLIIADDAAFTTNVSVVNPTSYISNNLLFNTTFTFNAANSHTQYFTLLVPGAPSVGGVLISETPTPATLKNTAELQVSSTTSGILLPSMTTVQMNAIAVTPPTGLLIFNTDIDRYMYYNGTAWNYVGSLIQYTTAQLHSISGSFGGELIYNTDTNTIWYWNDNTSQWIQLQ